MKRIGAGSDESKFNRQGSDGRRLVRRPVNCALDPKYCFKTFKHGGGSLMLWGCFSYYGMGPLVRIHGNLNRFGYRDILDTHLLSHARKNLPRSGMFMQDNDSKHTSRTVQTWLASFKHMSVRSTFGIEPYKDGSIPIGSTYRDRAILKYKYEPVS